MSNRNHFLFWTASISLILAGVGFWYLHSSKDSVSSHASIKPAKSQSDRQVGIHLLTQEEIEHTKNARPCDRTVLTYLDLSRIPTQQELIEAGNLGDPLTPTRQADPAKIKDSQKRARQEQENLAFGTAIQGWNQHRYEEAYVLFEQYLKDFPESPWAAEAELHLGCFCQYNGRLTEAAERFDQILSSVEKNSEMYHKAKLRRSILYLDQGNLEASMQGFTDMKRDDHDPAHQTYASYWIREIALLKGNETALRNCGQKALARVVEILGDAEVALELREMTAAGPHGFTAQELHATALLNGLNSQPVRADMALDDLPVPFVAHYQDNHYVTVEKVAEDTVRLYDSRVGEVSMPRQSFLKEWSGFALIFKEPSATAAIHPAENLDDIVGGCCGHPRAPSDLGDDDCEKNCGMPGWSVNPVNFNFRVSDTPMWWEPPVGPSVSMSLLFNSLDSLTNYEIFGSKWSFEYASYLLVTPGDQVQVRDGDGRLETFTAPTGGSSGYPVNYTSPAGDFRKLTQIADHVFKITHQDGTIYHYGIPIAMSGSASVPLLLSIEDRHGNTLSITHNAQGSIVSIGHSMLPPISGNPRLWNFVYGDFNGHDRVKRIDDPFGRSATFNYDDDGHLKDQTDMGGLSYGYDYTTKLSFDAISADVDDLLEPTSENPLTQELFIKEIITPKGTTTILTEPSNGVVGISLSQEELDQGYSVTYPPIGSPYMWTNYRIRVTDPEEKTSEYYFSGDDGWNEEGAVFYRNPIQLKRDPNESVAPTAGARDRIWVVIVGSVKGKIQGIWRYPEIGSNPIALFFNEYYEDSLQLKTHINLDKTTSYIYDNGKIKQIKLPKSNNSSLSPYKIHYLYQPNGTDIDKIQRYWDSNLINLLNVDYWPGTRNVKQSKDALNRITGYTWYSNGLIKSVTNNTSGDLLTFIYDEGTHDTDGITTWRLLKIINGTESTGDVVSALTYDGMGRLETQMDSLGDYSITTYDDLNRIIRNDFSDDTFSEQVWECCYISETRSGQVVNNSDRITDRTKLSYDHRGLLTQSIDTAGRITQFSYDDAGKFRKLIDPLNRVTEWTYDDFGRPEKKIYPDATFEKTHWSSDYLEEINGIESRQGDYYSMNFDAHDNLLTLSGSDTNVTRTYDAWDRLKTLKDTAYSSSIHDFEYDLLGRLTEIDGPWSDDTISWEYIDAQRKVIRTSPGSVTSTMISDSLGRLSSATHPLGTFTPSYDEQTARILSIAHSGDFDTDFTYLGADDGRALHTITSKLPNNSVIAKHTYGYDSQNRINSWKRESTMPNPSGTTHSFEWSSYYSFASQLNSVVKKSIAGTLQGGWDYAYDSAGNRTSTQISTDTTSPSSLIQKSHNNLNQITSIGGGGLATIRGTLSDPGRVSIGLTGSGDMPARMLQDNRFETELSLQTGSNSLSIAALDDSNNRSDYTFTVNVASQTPQTPSYDDNGNLLSDGIRSFEWDGLSRLTKITWATGKTTDFKYNALGQRCERIETDGSTVTKTYYLFDGIEVIDRRSGTTANIDRRYFSEGEQRKTSSSWNKFYYCRDHLGSVREVVKSNGILRARYDYDPYGKRITQYQASGYNGGCDFGFTGHLTAPSLETGQTEMVLTHYRAYDPDLGIWLSSDPLKSITGEMAEMLPEGSNLYAYVGSDPLNSWDPYGLWDWGEIGRAFSFKGGAGLEASLGFKLGPLKGGVGLGSSWVGKCDLGGGLGSSLESEAGGAVKFGSHSIGLAANNESGYYTPYEGRTRVIDETDVVPGYRRKSAGGNSNWVVGADAGLLAKAGFSIDLKRLFVDGFGLFGGDEDNGCP